MKSTEILKNAAAHIGDRAATYDKKAGERSIPATVAAFNAVTGHQLTAEQGWLFMALLKAVRSQQGAYRADSYEDGAAYFALAGEQAAVDRVSTNERLEKIFKDAETAKDDLAARDAERYRLLRVHVVPEDISRRLGVQRVDLEDAEGIADRVDSLLDEALSRRNRIDKLKGDLLSAAIPIKLRD